MRRFNPARAVNIEDLRLAAQQRLPRAVFDYIDGYAYGLGAAGGPGVASAIDILRTGIVRTMKLLGCSSVRDLDRSFVRFPADWLPQEP